MSWLPVARVVDFPPGSVRVFDWGGVPIAVFNVSARYYAITDVCSHEDQALSEGEVVGEEIVCPRHGARFSLETGAAMSPPAYEPVATFAVRVAGDWIEVEVPG